MVSDNNGLKEFKQRASLFYKEQMPTDKEGLRFIYNTLSATYSCTEDVETRLRLGTLLKYFEWYFRIYHLQELQFFVGVH